MTYAQVHRFRDCVAIALPGQRDTFYVSAKDARAIARALNAGARDIKANPFSRSTFKTVTFDLPYDAQHSTEEKR